MWCCTMNNNKHKFVTHKAKYKRTRLDEKQTWKESLLEVIISWLNFQEISNCNFLSKFSALEIKLPFQGYVQNVPKMY